MSERTHRRTITRAFVATAVTVSVALAGTSALAQQGQQGAQQGQGGQQRPAGQQGQQGGQQMPGQPGQQGPGGQGGGQGGGGGGGGFGGATQTPAFVNDTTGFTRILTPGSLTGWDGNPKFWSVKGDTIIAQSTPENVVDVNTFLIYRGDPNLRDFELKVDYRFPTLQGNSGVQIRSAVRPGAPHQWRVTGPQVDLDANLTFAGQIYGEEAGGFLARRGVASRTSAGNNTVQQIGTLGDAAELRGLFNPGGWNTLHIIAKGNTIAVFSNGRMTSFLVDENLAAGTQNPAQTRLQSGLVALQMHTGAPFVVQFRNIFLKKLQ